MFLNKLVTFVIGCYTKELKRSPVNDGNRQIGVQNYGQITYKHSDFSDDELAMCTNAQACYNLVLMYEYRAK